MSAGTAVARSGARRRADAVARFEARDGDLWVATGAGDGSVHLVPLSYAWDGEHILIAVAVDSPTARNLQASRRARLGFGPTRDVVLVEAEVTRSSPVRHPDAVAVGARYAAQADWDPREASASYLFVLLRPVRIQAWREANELAGRLLMRDGTWLT
ncbi:MAG TPA: pyridoxamine 5'-phosphate oxidase family protein [Candidatus Limnocylindrales bacterium]|nr:pyridoxamine 5'-phosphate oxidase family protein [Candidatus Limnocylindrales bacterium]